MAATQYPARLAWGLIALSLAAYPPGIRAAPLIQQPVVARPAADPDARMHQRLIIKLKDAEASTGAPLRFRTAQIAIGDLANRVRPVVERLGSGSVPLSLHRSIRPGLHVAAAGQPLRRAEMQQLIRQLRQDPRVEYAEIDERIQPQYTPSDPYYGSSQWDLHSSAPDVEGGASLPGAWDFGLGASASGSGVVVAVLDTGIRPHAELAGRILPGYDFVSDTDTANDQNGQWDSDPSDPGDWVSESDRTQAAFAGCAVSPSSWHGTSMAGMIAAASDNGQDIAGIAPHARILPVRVFGKCGGHVSDVIAGLYWSVGLDLPEVPSASASPPINPHPARVINLSMAAEGSCSQAFQEAIDQARARGAVVVAATGNHASGGTATALPQPANCSGVIAVTAHTRRGDLADYANVHPDITLSAPGGGQGRKQLGGDGNGITALSNSGSSSPLSDSLTQIAGTSIAAAHVSGVAALLLGLQPGWSPDQVELALTSSARAFPEHSDCAASGLCGAGMLDAAAAVRWQRDNPAPAVPPENTGGGGGAAGWPELLVLLSAALLARLRHSPLTARQPHDSSRAQAARQSGRM